MPARVLTFSITIVTIIITIILAIIAVTDVITKIPYGPKTFRKAYFWNKFPVSFGVMRFCMSLQFWWLLRFWFLQLNSFSWFFRFLRDQSLLCHPLSFSLG
jgi:hypothetical protein